MMADRIALLADRQSWRCIWCEFQMARDLDQGFNMATAEFPIERRALAGIVRSAKQRFARRTKATFEHVVPRAEGGTDALINGLVACLWCNNYRGIEDPEDFKERITALVQRGEHPRQIFRRTGNWPSGMPRKGAVAQGGAWRPEQLL